MSPRKLICCVGLAAVGLATWSNGIQAAPPNPFHPQDEFVIASGSAPLMRGHDTLAVIGRGQTLRVLKTEGPWIGTAATVNGGKVGGWIWAGQAATPERYAAMRARQRRYSFAPTPSYGAAGGYNTGFGGANGVLPNQESPSRLEMGITPYGPSYWRADRKIMGY